MMDLSALDDLVEHQDRGAEMTVIHPVTGEIMSDVRLTVAGPDSDVQRRARLRFNDDLMAFRGKPPADEYEKLDIERLARCVIGWSIVRDGNPVPFTFTAAVRLFTSFQFIREQAEAFAGSRVEYFKRLPLDEDE